MRKSAELAVFRKQEAALKDTQKAVDEIRASRNARTARAPHVEEAKKKIDEFAFSGYSQPLNAAPNCKSVEFFACKHYPCATSNHFAGLSVCEHGCEKTALRWWEGGTHSKP